MKTLKFMLLMIGLIFLTQSCCNPECENLEPHKYSIGAIVHHRLDSSNKFIILDTTRDVCNAEYRVEDSTGDKGYILESSLTQ
jgi:hypothetical protein